MGEEKLPNLIIAGVNKAGTTSLFTYLSEHSEVCSSSVKETCYFLPLRYDEEIAPIGEYAKHFTHCKRARHILESTPGYFYGGAKVAKQIQETLKGVRIILIFRNPIHRLFSFFKSMKSKLQIAKDLSIDEYVGICDSLDFSERRERINNRFWGLDGGFYDEYLNEWFCVFGNSLKILFFEHLRDDPSRVLEGLSRWLEIDYAGFESMGYQVENRTVNYRSKLLHRTVLSINSQGEEFLRNHLAIKRTLRKLYNVLNEKRTSETIPQSTLAYLESLYGPHNRRLASDLRKRGYSDLPEWLEEGTEATGFIRTR